VEVLAGKIRHYSASPPRGARGVYKGSLHAKRKKKKKKKKALNKKRFLKLQTLKG
jgi:hypothetical protein